MRSAFVVLALALVAACVGRAPQAALPAEEPVTVLMVNANWATVNVYAVRDGSWSRLGTVVTNTKSWAKLPGWAVTGAGTVRLRIEAIGSGETYVTDPILVSSGRQITLSVQPALRMTSWAVH